MCMIPRFACSKFCVVHHKMGTLEKAIAEKMRGEIGWVYSTALISCFRIDLAFGRDWNIVLNENRNRKMLFNF